MEIGWTDVGSGGYILVSCVKLPDAKTLNASVFSYLRLKIVMWMTKNACAYITVPEMDSRQMRLISYSGDQKLLQIR
jgi:hypothetical protein